MMSVTSDLQFDTLDFPLASIFTHRSRPCERESAALRKLSTGVISSSGDVCSHIAGHLSSRRTGTKLCQLCQLFSILPKADSERRSDVADVPSLPFRARCNSPQMAVRADLQG